MDKTLQMRCTGTQVFSIKIDKGYVSSIKTRNSTRENIKYNGFKQKISSKVILSFIVPSTVPFCRMTQHNLPATEKRVTKGLMNRKVLRRRARMF